VRSSWSERESILVGACEAEPHSRAVGRISPPSSWFRADLGAAPFLAARSTFDASIGDEEFDPLERIGVRRRPRERSRVEVGGIGPALEETEQPPRYVTEQEPRPERSAIEPQHGLGDTVEHDRWKHLFHSAGNR
jgi:hypothetical protein